MSKHNRYSRQRDLAHENEVLNSKVRLDGVGEDPIVKAVLSDEFVNMPDAEAGQIALMLQELIRGQHSLLANQDTMSDRIHKLEAQWAEYDKHAKEWEEDREKFFEDHYSDAQRKLEMRPEQQATLRVQEAIHLQEEISKVRVRGTVNKLKFAEELSRMPKEMVISPGVWLRKALPGGGSQMVLVPEEIRIKDRVWRLPPNQMVEVPKIVADRLREKRRGEQETEARKKILMVQDDGSTSSMEKVQREWDEINKQFGSGGDAFPLV